MYEYSVVLRNSLTSGDYRVDLTILSPGDLHDLLEGLPNLIHLLYSTEY